MTGLPFRSCSSACAAWEAIRLRPGSSRIRQRCPRAALAFAGSKAYATGNHAQAGACRGQQAIGRAEGAPDRDLHSSQELERRQERQ
jgi:hypothetical protein